MKHLRPIGNVYSRNSSFLQGRAFYKMRYGILIGNRKHYPLPGRLFRHGENFDFMISFKTFSPQKNEWKNLIKILQAEITASQTLEEIIFNSRSKEREHYTSLHRPLHLE